MGTDVQFRDLRRTLATALGAAGCTDDQIRAITGHKTRSVVAVYVRPDTHVCKGGNEAAKTGTAEQELNVFNKSVQLCIRTARRKCSKNNI